MAQLNQAYQHGFKDMQGFARLNRAANQVLRARPAWRISPMQVRLPLRAPFCSNLLGSYYCVHLGEHVEQELDPFSGVVALRRTACSLASYQSQVSRVAELGFPRNSTRAMSGWREAFRYSSRPVSTRPVLSPSAATGARLHRPCHGPKSQATRHSQVARCFQSI